MRRRRRTPLRSCMLHARSLARTHAPTPARTHARTRARTHARTHAGSTTPTRTRCLRTLGATSSDTSAGRATPPQQSRTSSPFRLAVRSRTSPRARSLSSRPPHTRYGVCGLWSGAFCHIACARSPAACCTFCASVLCCASQWCRLLSVPAARSTSLVAGLRCPRQRRQHRRQLCGWLGVAHDARNAAMVGAGSRLCGERRPCGDLNRSCGGLPGCVCMVYVAWHVAFCMLYVARRVVCCTLYVARHVVSCTACCML